MAETVHDDVEKESTLKLDTGHALQTIGYNSILAAENGTSSDDEAPEGQDIQVEDAQTAIGFSIGREQTRLTSPQTPAVEKAAAIEKAGGFWGSFDGTEETLVEEDEDAEEDLEPTQLSLTEAHVVGGADHPSTVEPESLLSDRPSFRTETELLSSWRDEPNVPTQVQRRPKPGLFDGLISRIRSSSGAESSVEGWQKSLISSLPSMPKHFSITSPFSGAQETKRSSEADAKDVPLRSTRPRRHRSESDSQMPAFNRNTVLPDPDLSRDALRRGSTQTSHSKTDLLRRSTSDNSLTTQRTLSRSETLGDDSRFEDVNSQVNNRFKAVKDSWQDANIKIPSLSNIRVPNFTPEFLRERGSSMNKSQGNRSSSMVARGRTAKPTDPMTRQLPPYAKEAFSLAPSQKLISHPHFHRALDELEGDLVVLGGYRGSILRFAQPPHRQVWVPIKVGLNIRKVNLEVGFDEDSDERAADHIIPDGMLTHIGPVDISRRLFKRLRACENVRNGKLTIQDYGYDWRLSPHHLSGELIRYLEKLPCNQPDVPSEKRGATVIAHSLGGLITRHAVNQRPELFRGVVYAGVPQSCVNILGPLRHGDEVLLSQRVLTAQVNLSIRTSFALLPLDGRCFLDINTSEEYPVDFFDVNTWIDLRLSPCVNRPLPPLQPPPKPTGITAYVSSMASAFPSLPLRGRKDGGKPTDPAKITTAGGAAGATMHTSDSNDIGMTPTLDDSDATDSVRTAVTVPREKAIEYLERTLRSVKRFKQELDYNPKHSEANVYPPFAVIYGKSTPTVYGAKVNGREGIKHADAYDNLAFASGDGVVLARAAMAPEGYRPARGGLVSSDRGHVTLLGDLEAIGK
jgi:pimeloyl-ACP methyl ester carboxylesterase